MPVVQMNAEQGMTQALINAARALPKGAPILVMMHGYRYSPSIPAHDPHRHILSPIQVSHAPSWPHALGFGTSPDEGLAIAFGWEARGTLRAAYGRAENAGNVLADTVSELAQQSGRQVGLIGHSLGGRVALQSMKNANAGSLGRVILLNAAEFRDTAAAALHTPAGQRAEVINVTARENDLFDFALERLLSRGRRRALGLGLESRSPNWVDLQIDDATTLDALADLGFPTERGARRLSHWTPYLRGGLFDFYRAALCHPWALPLGLLRHHLPDRLDARWSRLLARPATLGAMRA
jgi:pimeloyl-ACP methyl ester carboxylesterase